MSEPADLAIAIAPDLYVADSTVQFCSSRQLGRHLANPLIR